MNELEIQKLHSDNAALRELITLSLQRDGIEGQINSGTT